MARHTVEFQSIRSEGGLLPPDLLRRVIDPKEHLEGTRPEDYGLPQNERLNEVITQSWNRLCKHWAEFQAAAANLPAGEPGTGLTNDKWSLPLLRELGFGLLPTSAGPAINGRTYAINRFFGPVPIHLVGCGLSLDRRVAGVRGAASANPHGLVQEFLNRSAGHVWGIVSNGLRLRVLRDSQALSRQSFLEFDLESMFAGEVYSDFVLLWLIAHATRFLPHDGERAETCFLELWTKVANEQGTRALQDLRGGVERALQILGEGFTSHPRNVALRDVLRTGQVSPVDFHGQLLRVVYRLIFLFVAEDRTIDGHPLLHARDESAAAQLARQRYAAHYSTARLRSMAAQIKGSRHGDLWRQFNLLAGALGGDEQFKAAREQLALPVLGSFLWSASSTASLNDAEITNHDFLEALRDLAFTRQGKVLRPVDYKNLGAEELGGVYESLLALTPQISSGGACVTFAKFAGNERKKSGSFYTSDSLVQCLLDSALDPVVAQAIDGKTAVEAEQAILALRVCDPAVGSGHFLVGAAHRMARHLARVRAQAEGESEPSPLLYQHALRDIIGHCLYGVDINPMAAELCRVSLWLEALEPGKPLSFLDHHIRVGNSLFGATPALLAEGIPDEAFVSIEGDDPEVCKHFKKINKDEHRSQGRLFAASTQPWEQLGNLAASMIQLDSAPDDSIEAVREKERSYEEMVRSGNYLDGRFLADTWCAAFVWKKTTEFTYPITEEVLRRVERNPHACDPWMRTEIERLASQYQFFHWYLAFPDVFQISNSSESTQNLNTGLRGGFDVVLGNPPWEQLEQQGQDQFDEVIAGSQHFIEHGQRFQITGKGRKNLYGLFAELASYDLAEQGSIGLVLPTGLLQDQPASDLASSLSRTNRISSVFDFENRRKTRNGDKWFPDAHPQQRFSLFTFRKDSIQTKFVFDVGEFSDLHDEDRFYFQSFADIDRFCDSGFKVPMFRQAIDARIATVAHRRGIMMGVLMRGERPLLRSALVFNAEREVNDEKRAFNSTNTPSEMVRVYEGSYIHQFDHRFATFADGSLEYLTEQAKSNPVQLIRTETYLPWPLVTSRLRALFGCLPPWILVLRRQARATDSFISISAIIPCSAIEGSLTCLFSNDTGSVSPIVVCANLNSFIFNFLTRLRQAGANLNKNVYSQLPVIKQDTNFGTAEAIVWIMPRALELTYTSWDLCPLSQDCSMSGPPFRWNDERRFLLRCELDAIFFHLYLSSEANADLHRVERESPNDEPHFNVGVSNPRDAASYIMDTFPIVQRKDEEAWHEFRTKRVTLEIYDAMADAVRTGVPYQTRLDPPPADASCRHPKKKIGILAFGSLITDPGIELLPKIGMRIKTKTPFSVEYGRISLTRGGAPTLVPHESGIPVLAEILVLDDDVSIDEAKNMLWRRETRHEGTGRAYARCASENSVLVEEFHSDPCVETVLYTDFNPSGKIPNPDANGLAKKAIASAKLAPAGKDGITYLMEAKRSGIDTPLTAAYQTEILNQTVTITLDEALKEARERQ